ncbi:MAG: hypothetical protein ACTSUD_07635 [Alphaproteobacteria bacterium]
MQNGNGTGIEEDWGDDVPMVPAGAGGGWSVNRLAVDLRLDRRTVAKRLHNVEPVGQGSKGPVYGLAEAARALFGQSELDDLNRRILVAKAEAAELDLAAKRGEMVRADDVRRAAAAHALAEREALLNLPDRIAPVLAAELDTDQVRLTAALERQVRGYMESRAGDDDGGA